MIKRMRAALGLSLMFSGVSMATVITANVPCGPGTSDDLTLWIEADSGSCSQTSPGVYECWETSNDHVRASCTIGCEEVRIDTGSTSVAGCWQGPNSPGTSSPNHTVTCPNGNTFDLKGVAGDTCKTLKSAHGVVVGGKCSRVGRNGQEKISASTSCGTGCVESTPPGDCIQR